MKKMKAFTLIELLAVIVLLGIIAVITTPIIFNIVKSSKESAFLSSIDSAMRTIALNQIENNTESMTYNLKEGSINPQIDIKGKIEGNGFLTINDMGNIRLIISNKSICARKEYADARVVIDYNECDINPEEEKNLDTSGASVPQIDTSMVAVTYQNNKWIKADKKNADKNNQWYNYNKGMWANMVVIKKQKKQEYQNKKVGEEINLEDVVGFFVGIPNFSYKLTEGVGERAFDVKFSDNVVENYDSHPAFTWGETKITGFWAAKFETTGSKDKITILPNQSAIKSTSLTTMYQSILDINKLKPHDKYNEILSEIHLIKNTEWGAITILTQSIYGRCHENGCDKVEKNSTWNTGYADKNSPYDTEKGVLASTTGNIFGIYDMNGCTWEFTMGTNKVSTIDSDMKIEYYDTYFNKGIMGDLTTEDGTSAWYGSDSVMLSSYKNWFVRGGDVNTANSSLFWYNADSTSGGFRNGFRITYVIK